MLRALQVRCLGSPCVDDELGDAGSESVGIGQVSHVAQGGPGLDVCLSDVGQEVVPARSTSAASGCPSASTVATTPNLAARTNTTNLARVMGSSGLRVLCANNRASPH